jgi:flavin reductase (DIM6/NTAB) family NADH-FMN oxidoreductase RutF
MTADETLPALFRDVMSGVVTPVTVVTAMDADRPHGTTVSAFASLSLKPPMVLVCLDRDSELLALISAHQRFGVNVLRSTQAALARNFARKGSDKFAGIDWAPVHGLPRLAGSYGWLACSVAALIDGGDHVVAFGHVLAAEAQPAEPLSYHARLFGTHRTLGEDADGGLAAANGSRHA